MDRQYATSLHELYQHGLEGPISTAQLVEMYERLPSDFESNQSRFNPDCFGFLNEGYFDLQGMMIPDSSKDNGRI